MQRRNSSTNMAKTTAVLPTAMGILLVAGIAVPWALLAYLLLFQGVYEPRRAQDMEVCGPAPWFGELMQTSNSTKRFHKYGPMYAQYLDQFLHKPVRMLEIGLGEGGSIEMWRNAFENGRIYGVDRGKGPQGFRSQIRTNDRSTIITGDQANVTFLKELTDYVMNDGGLLDFLIDDGGHTMNQQITAFTHLFTLVKPGGYYFIEDLETSYYPGCDWGCYDQCCGGGPPGKKLTTVDMIKSFIDVLNSDFTLGPNTKFEYGRAKYSVNPVDHLIETFQCWRNMCMMRRRLEE